MYENGLENGNQFAKDISLFITRVYLLLLPCKSI